MALGMFCTEAGDCRGSNKREEDKPAAKKAAVQVKLTLLLWSN